MTIRDRINDFYNRFLSLSGRPEEIARAMALGVFIGVTPTIPFHTALVMVGCLIFRQNITAGMLGATIISNPLTIPFFYLAEYELGILVLGLDPNPFALTDYNVRAILEIGLGRFSKALARGKEGSPQQATPSEALLSQRFGFTDGGPTIQVSSDSTRYRTLGLCCEHSSCPQ